MSEALVGRQAIFNRDLSVFGYELLFRGAFNPEDPAFGDQATSRVIVNAFSEIGLETLVAGKKAFLNLTRSFITGRHTLPFKAGSIVLEVLESVEAEPEVLAGLERLKHRGFTIALDDFVFFPGCEGLIALADLIKLDVLGQSDDEVRAQVAQVSFSGARLLAEKIETREQYEACREMGFEYFQGYFLERPSLLKKRSVDPHQLTLISLLRELYSPEFNFRRAQDIVEQDLGLCYRLLRHINSAFYGMPRKISSVREALVYLGMVNIRNLTSLFLLAANEETPAEMINVAMLRARMCERLAHAASFPDSGEFFVVGLFSTLDAIMEIPMKQLLESLPLSPPQKAALGAREGIMGSVLSTVVAYEHGEWDDLECFGLTPGRIKELYVDSLRWSQSVGAVGAGEAA